MTEGLFEVSREWTNEDVFDRFCDGFSCATTSSGCLSDTLPACSAVACSSISRGVDEGFQQVDGMSILFDPVFVQATDDSSQNIARKMWNLDPGQDEETCVVRSEDQVSFSGIVRPAQPLITISTAPRRGSKQQGSKRSPLVITDPIGHALPNGSLESNGMIFG